MTSVNKIWQNYDVTGWLTCFVAVTSESQPQHVARSSQGRHKVVVVASQSHHSCITVIIVNNALMLFVVDTALSRRSSLLVFWCLTRTTLTLVKYCASASEKRCTLDTIIGWVDPWVGLGWAESQQYTNVSAESAYCGDCTSYSFQWMIMSLNRILLLLSYWISPVTHCIQHSAALAM